MTVFRVLLRMRVRPGSGPAFERDWRAGATRIATRPASVGQWLARGTDEEEVYYVVSDWTDEASFREYERSEAHQQHLRRLRPYRMDGSMSTMDIVVAVTA
ncbi:antibiotic biosynthesis monooxygenase [Amycolatopsis balhimycina DSM 5908]|uniref:Antibiotic biosynthesis monooxygenase n=1 Tax=Amycolatopsis balhimycina DSM 5908 TaxID=1081091 RepID=A0A428WPA6_AMYBA|nr:antibiotic biosynthesis monooxygenase family protein [Amycolatopsis balhimycina]RSM44883.1 antibiotic biosynthesis monooxygenase [Amycolatopsis balhimycina DSM 5908]